MGGGTPPPSSLAGGRSPRPSRSAGTCVTASWHLCKMFFFKSLQKDVADLQRENTALKSIARSRLRQEDTALLEGCDTNDRRRQRWSFAPPLPPSRRWATVRWRSITATMTTMMAKEEVASSSSSSSSLTMTTERQRQCCTYCMTLPPVAAPGAQASSSVIPKRHHHRLCHWRRCRLR